MQQLFDFSTTWYFAAGETQKTSLCSQYCRQNDYIHLVNPAITRFVEPIQKSTIIQGSPELLRDLEPRKPQITLLYFGEKIDEKWVEAARQYSQIGKLYHIKDLTYESFRKQLYPNLIFFYGPVPEQNAAASVTLARTINYEHSVLPKNANALITHSKKSHNYVIDGLFTDPEEIKILENYFVIRIVHFKFNRIDLPGKDEFFNLEYQLLPFLKTKPYYLGVRGDIDPVKIMDIVGIGLCPRLIYINIDNNTHDDYIQEYVNAPYGLLLKIEDINRVIERKRMPPLVGFEAIVRFLTEVFYKDLDRKEIALSGFPTMTSQFVYLENLNRKFDCFVDLSDSKHLYHNQMNSKVYFLEERKVIKANTSYPLADQLSPKASYWVVGGASGSGKTTVAKYISEQFGYKMIEFEKDIAVVKEKLANPDEGQEVPLKKILNHYANMISQDQDSTYIFDALPYENNDLTAWITTVGAPIVINLSVQEKQQIKRTRKKAEGDLAAEISEEQTAKAKENTQKAEAFIQKVKQTVPSCKIVNLDYNKPEIIAENDINAILRPKIYLAQNNIHFAFQNIAILHGMEYINLSKTPLRESQKLIKKRRSNNVILNYYAEKEDKLVVEDLHWIEKHLGEIRYVGIAVSEAKESAEEKMVLEKPVQEEKPKPAEEEGGEEKPPEDQQEGEAKKGFDIYAHQWTLPAPSKNISQWFFKMKKNIKERSTGYIDCSENFDQILKIVEEQNGYVYEIVN